MTFLMEDEYILTKDVIPKYYERTSYKGEGASTIINFNLGMKKVSLKELRQRINYFVLGLTDNR